jgi:gamma-glutamyltranspeptidase/glutathione hydrolase
MKSTVLSALFLLITTFVQAQFRYSGRSFASRSEVIARHGMAATSQPLATQVALDVLKKGGSAVDAAIAANALLGLVEPTGNGIGGDLFAIVWDAKTKKLYGFNGSGRSPKSLSLAYFEQQQMKQIPGSGALSVSVPGCVDGWYTLHERFGKLPMKDLLQPTVNYAREGYPVTEVIAFLWQGYARSLQKFPNYRQLYMPGGQAPQKGDIFRNEDLASTLEKIIKGGRDAFYKGDIARTIAATVKRDGGFLSYEDLATHRSNWIDPVSTNYRGYDVWELPPNGQGIAVLQMLNILEGFDLKKMGFGSPAHLHAMIEAKKLVFEDRAVYYADPDFYQAPTAQLIAKPYAAGRRKLIDSLRAGRNYKAGLLEGASNTIYLTTADQDGNMVSLIQSNYAGMGSGIVPDGLGFSLQNRGTSFTLEKGKPNTFEPGKRPFHTLIPAFITKDGQPYVSFGVMGADFQAQGHIQIITNLIDFGMNLQEAGDAPRFSHSGSSGPTGSKAQGGGQVSLENGFPAETIQQLMRMGHEVGYDLRGYGGYQGILYDRKNKVYYGASESRKDGHAAGY